MNKHLDPLFRDIRARAGECAECKVLLCNGHAPRCSQYIQPPAVPYAADGFVRTVAGRIDGFATGNAAPRVIEYVDDSWLRTPSVGQQLARLGRKRRAA